MLYHSFYVSEASSLEDISLASTPKRSSTSQTASTPAPVPVIESAEAIEAKAALKQVRPHTITPISWIRFLENTGCHVSIISPIFSCRRFLRITKKKRQIMKKYKMNSSRNFRIKLQICDHKTPKFLHN